MSDISSFTAANQRQTKKFVERAMAAGRVPFITACPGVGKSAIIHTIARERGLKMIDHRLSTSAPEDLNGLPRFTDKGAEFVPFADLFPLEGDSIPQGYNGWLLFLDELPSAPRSVQAAAYKLILDRMVGQKRLHEMVFVVAAGNRKQDKAIVNDIGTAMQSRLIHIEMDADFKCWQEDVAIPQQFDPRVVAYLSMNPSKLIDFDPDHQDRTFCCPRTWEFVSDLIKGRPLESDDAILLAGAITSGEAISFVQFCHVYDSLPNMQSLIDDPENAIIPRDPASLWATTMACVEHTTVENFGDFMKYMNRLDLVQRVLYFRATYAKLGAPLRSSRGFTEAAIELGRYIS
ncbi:ATPase [Achromobacter phage vB_AxyP_19-32_Axy11]|uniref:ATPase AAA-type core domain-containing protein n=1 Tax=Achromobacter phage vB_AxyP_19-32_Axy11 TaxID=2591042 RepID=A0A514CU59_9CAUD|nr:ATPase [Achromobacter phage vB_AxyP_19-32_Axy11]QDH84013.1 hypothetical protein Axy11_028 [Achromobacter phage vB_AxyP_19-32_Axy11]